MPPRPILLLAILLHALLASAPDLAAKTKPSRLRDISVVLKPRSWAITLLVDGAIGTLVAEHTSNSVQLRARSVAATKEALSSARRPTGVTSVKARIERRDVLVVDVTFARENIDGVRVVRRTTREIIVEVTIDKVPSAPKGAAERSAPSSRVKSARRKWALTTIVIDAGHGGRDPGTIGIGGVEEKAITLAIAKTLKRELERTMKGVTVVLTRSGDESLELYRRGQIANERNGRLFVSIHANAQPDTTRDINGFECYILRPGKSAEAARVAAVENGAVRFESDQKRYEDLSTESTIVASMAQSAFARYSELAAQSIRTSMRTGTKLKDRGVHQAGFFVLVGAAMPAVLVEVGYLSSRRDARILRSASGQRSIATAIAKGITRYAKTYAASLQ